jgi:hypothetical protein
MEHECFKRISVKAWGYWSVVELLPSMCKALDVISNTPLSTPPPKKENFCAHSFKEAAVTYSPPTDHE